MFTRMTATDDTANWSQNKGIYRLSWITSSKISSRLLIEIPRDCDLCICFNIYGQKEYGCGAHVDRGRDDGLLKAGYTNIV